MGSNMSENGRPKKKRGRRTMRRPRGIVKGYLEHKSRALFESKYDELEKSLPYKRGVYALYKGGNLYYVGIAPNNLMHRLWRHTRDRHARKWDAFSMYSCKSLKQIGFLEALLVRIARPPGNNQDPSLGGGAENLDRELRRRNQEARLLYQSAF